MINFKKAMIFSLGALSGVGILYFYGKVHKKNEEEIAENDSINIDSSNTEVSSESEIETNSFDYETLTTQNYETIIQNNGYDKKTNIKPQYLKPSMVIPVVVSYEEFGENEDYEKIELTYYSGDGMLADDNDEIIEEPVNTIGLEALKSIENCENGSIFVKNDKLKSYYEIKVDNDYLY